MFWNHVPWTLDTGKQPFSESSSSSSPKHFFGGKSLVADLDKIHTKQCIFMMVRKRPVVIFLAHPIPLSHWNGHIATVVSVDFSLVVRISEDACPSVH